MTQHLLSWFLVSVLFAAGLGGLSILWLVWEHRQVQRQDERTRRAVERLEAEQARALVERVIREAALLPAQPNPLPKARKEAR